jgi:tetratricopeptide (TPR) repeat protein
MNYRLLLVTGFGQAVSSPLRVRTLRQFPGPGGLSVHFRPIRNDLLFESAKVAGQLVFRILAGEGIVRGQLWVEYEVLGESINVIGRSSDLLFALALLTSTWPNSPCAAYTTIAGTGMLDDDGNIKSVEHTTDKIAAAIRDIESGARSVVFYPASELPAIDLWRASNDVPKHIHLQPVAHIEEALVHLGYSLEKVYLRNPFRGLEHFEFADHAIFFGRDAEVRDVVSLLLRREAVGTPGVLVEGASGSGKSSFLHAGVLPTLVSPRSQSDAIQEAIARAPVNAGVRQTVWRPGILPAGADEYKIASEIRRSWSRMPELHDGILNDTANLQSLADWRRQCWPSTNRFVWLIDQFEEIFNLGLNNAVVDAFGSFLSQLQSDGVWVLASIRADALPQLKEHESLRKIFGANEGQYYLGTLNGPALDEVIERPAIAADLTFGVGVDGKSLDQRLREDTYREKDSLPLLQFTLNELYQTRSGNELTWASYERLGGIAGSIATAAQLVLNAEAESQQATPGLFRSLVTVDEGGRPSRRYVPISDIAADPVQYRLLSRLIAARLCVTDQRNGQPVVAFAHDTLLYSLPPLTDWLSREAVLMQTRELAQRDTHEWQKHGESDTWLAPADKLIAFKSIEDAGIFLPLPVKTFIGRSRRRVRRNTRVKQAVMACIVILAIAATSFGISFRLERDAAIRSEQRAQVEAQTALDTSNFLVKLFKVVDPSESRGNTVTAREILDRGAAQIRSQLFGQPVVKARLMRTIGEVYGNLGLNDKSQPLIEDALAEVSRPGIADDVDVARAKKAMGGALAGREDYKGAEPYLLDAMRVFDSHPGLDKDSALIRGDLGFLYWSSSDYARAQPILEDAAKRADASFGHQSDEMANILSTLGITVRDRGDPERGLGLLRESTKIYKDLFGEDYYWYAMGRQSIGLTLSWLGKYAEAKENLEAGNAIIERVLGPSHGILGEGLQGLGYAETQLGDFAEAEKTLKRALVIETAANGPDSKEVSRTLRNLGAAFAGAKAFDEALPIYERSVSIARLRFGGDSSEYGSALGEMGLVQRRAGRLEDARATQRESLAIFERHYEAPIRLVGALSSMADILCFHRPDAEGFALAQRAINMHGTSFPLQLAIVKSVAAYCDPDPAHIKDNAKTLGDAHSEIVKERGISSPQTEDVIRRLKRFHQNWGDTH